MFHSATLKLTAFYMAILLLICLIFNVLIYKILVGELDRSFAHQTDFFEDKPRFRPFWTDPEAQLFLNNEREEGQQRILLALLFIDLGLLTAGGFASFLLAKKTLQPIEAAHESQLRFTADASHELRTPLATMQTEIEVALRDPKLKLKETKALLKSNLEEIAILRQLTQNLLGLARSNDDPPTLFPQSINESILITVERAQKLAATKHITIHTKLPEKLQAITDSTQFSELLHIFLDNGIKYGPEQSNIYVTASKEKESAVVTIRDEGIGMKPEEQEHIFERFYRADHSRNQKGYGLGLSIAQQLAKQLKISIHVESAPSKGTTIKLVLPKSA